MNILEIDTLLYKARLASDKLRKQGKTETADLVLQVTSLLVLPFLPKGHKVVCPYCKKQLTKGIEVEFYNHTGLCYTCDAAYVDAMEEVVCENSLME